MTNHESGGGLLSGLFTGIAIGVALGLLYAPRPGREARADLRNRAAEFRDRAEDFGEDVRDRFDEFGCEISSRLRQVADNVGACREEFAGKEVV